MQNKILMVYSVKVKHPETGWADTKIVKSFSGKQAAIIAKGIVEGEHGDLAPYSEFIYTASKGVPA